jgi:hypothetical protein
LEDFKKVKIYQGSNPDHKQDCQTKNPENFRVSNKTNKKT